MKKLRFLAMLLVPVAAFAMTVSWNADVTPPGGAIDEISLEENGECSATAVSEDTARQSCGDCPKKHDGCGRVSCDPCCYRCPGDPILRCF